MRLVEACPNLSATTFGCSPDANKSVADVCRRSYNLIFGRPADLNPSLREEAEQLFRIKQNPEAIDQPLNKYVIAQVIAMLISISVFIGWEDDFSIAFKTGFTLLVMLTLINCGAIMEQKRWVFQVELIRLSLLLLVPFYYPQYPSVKLGVIICVLIVLGLYYRSAKTLYLSYIYKSKPEKT